ncbi:MAG: hypothetical protein WHS88_03920 [Anaerohalosphaeraceae bacterium]
MKTNRLHLLLAAASILLLNGCQTFQTASTEKFGAGGIPGEKYRVGGGYQIRYVAPEAGVVYLVEHRTGTLLGTESLRRGDAFEFFPTPEVVEGFRRVGIELARGEFVIYFVPASVLYHR